MKFKSLFVLAISFVLSLSLNAQRIQPKLGRGVVAVNNGSSVLVTWRRLAQEAENATYNIYADGRKVNASPVRNTNFQTTTSQIPFGSKVSVTIIENGKESAQSIAFEFRQRDARSMFMDINFEQGGSPLKSSDFNTAYVWPVDLDGNGEMDYVVNRKSNTNGLDCYVEGYLSSGQHLWTVKLGPNELSCAGQDDMITACDMDCDGYADVVIQSSDGTQFWNPETKSFGLYVNGGTNGDTDKDGIIDYETQGTRNAPRYISVIDGLTGMEKASIEQSYNTHYNRTNRASLMGDEYNKHVGHMGVFFFDGIHPGVVMEWHMRGSSGDHHYYNLGVAYDFSSGKAGRLKELFNEPTGAPAFHQIRIGDVDGDGCDEMIVGGYTMNNTGRPLFNTGISHGDRFRTSDIDPERPGLETFAIQQYAGDMLGQVLYDAGNGEFIKKWYMAGTGDVGRGECMDVDPAHLGWEMWSTMDGNVYDAQGNLITEYGNQYPCEGIWWDGVLDRENVNTSDSHYNVYINKFMGGNRLIEIAKPSGYRYTTVYAKRAAFWGDIIGDWREELILLHKENGVIVGICGFSTDISTSINNIYCLLEDPHYQGDCTTKGYYQSPNPGFYLGYDMPRPQLPPVMVTDLVAQPNGGYTDYSRSTSVSYSDGKSMLFDLNYGSNTYNISSDIKPGRIYAMPVKGQTITFGGSGSLSGSMDLWKSQQGTLQVDVPLNHTGKTYISEGILSSDNVINGDVELRARGTLSGNPTVEGSLNVENALNYEGGRLMPGSKTSLGTILLKKSLTVNGRMFAEMNITSSVTSDLIHIDGDLTLGTNGSIVFTIVPDQTPVAAGRYKLIEYTGAFSGDVSKFSIRGIVGVSYSIENKDNAIWFVINEQRNAMTGVRWIGNESNVWNYQDSNFEIESVSTDFVANDGVVIDDGAQSISITLNELFPISGIEFANNSKSLTLNGTGGFTGSGGLTKNGSGRVNLNCINSSYTGKTIINSGTVSVKELADGGLPSSFGAASAISGNFQLGKATLIIDNSSTSTNRILTLNDTAVVSIPNGNVSFKGQVVGNGRMVKRGSGQVNFTYGGTNTFKGGISLEAGSIAQGSWNSTFGPAGAPIDVKGNCAITVFNNNSTNAVPTLNNKIDVAKSKTLTINAGQRCKIGGSFTGEGTVKISFPYVRGDFYSNMSKFEGVLNPTSGQFRITSSMDLSNGTFKPEAGVYAVSTQSQSGTESSLTHKIGALVSTASDCQLSTGVWNVGYLGTNTTYAGIIGGGGTLNKYGDGTLTLTGSSSGALNVYAGFVSLDNATSTTKGMVTAQNGGTVLGTGKTANITVNKGGTVGAGKATGIMTGTLTLSGNLSVKSGGIVRVRARSTNSVDKYVVEGNVSLASPIFDLSRLSGDWSADTDYKVFDCSGKITLSGTPSFIPEEPIPGYMWDYSSLVSDGILRIVENPASGIDGISSDGQLDIIYDLSGRKIDVISKPGIYIVNGKKIVVN